MPKAYTSLRGILIKISSREPTRDWGEGQKRVAISRGDLETDSDQRLSPADQRRQMTWIKSPPRGSKYSKGLGITAIKRLIKGEGSPSASGP